MNEKNSSVAKCLRCGLVFAKFGFGFDQYGINKLSLVSVPAEVSPLTDVKTCKATT